MPLHQFVLVLDRPPNHRQATILTRQYHDLDSVDGTGRVVVQRRAPSLAEAVVSAVRDLEAASLYPVRVFDGDWVTLGHIAERIDRSREIVRLWAAGKQEPGGFPPAVNPGRLTSFYSWAEVSVWLREQMGFDLPDEEPILAVMNLTLQLRHLAPRIAITDPFRLLLAPEPPFEEGGTRGKPDDSGRDSRLAYWPE